MDPSWISVTERLPERGQEVLVFEKRGYVSVRYIPVIMPLWERRSRGLANGDKISGDDGTLWYPGGLDIMDHTSHWMPIPSPPPGHNYHLSQHLFFEATPTWHP